MRPKFLLIAGLGLALVVIVVAAFVVNVDPGHVGVRINKCSGGGVDDVPLGIGYHWQGPCTDVTKYPTYQQTMVLTRAPTEGGEHDESITVTSSEGLPINVDASMSFTLEEGRVPHIYKKFRRDLEHIQSSFMRQTIREALQETFARYTAQQLYSDKRETARAEVQGLLTKKLVEDGFNITQFTLNETRVPDAVTQAINAKVAMVQEAQRAEQEVRKTEALAKQKITAAEGEATARKLRADAEAYANERIAKSLTPALVEYMKVTKWDGKLPEVTGGNTPFINLNK
ncbi:MAG TPA: prohibitin family protein [Polyangia bacterium]|jgi:regulator of protease activity HflC (stomatin/prohibitin superfamily)|nr:prohibitin family protein [Polyangia bacterium]